MLVLIECLQYDAERRHDMGLLMLAMFLQPVLRLNLRSRKLPHRLKAVRPSRAPLPCPMDLHATDHVPPIKE
jgi:hypothetical protein